jgi:hypothetical protein
MASLAILLDAMELGRFLDDRPPPSSASDLMDRVTEKRNKNVAYTSSEKRLSDESSGFVPWKNGKGGLLHKNGVPPSEGCSNVPCDMS